MMKMIGIALTIAGAFLAITSLVFSPITLIGEIIIIVGLVLIIKTTKQWQQIIQR